MTQFRELGVYPPFVTVGLFDRWREMRSNGLTIRFGRCRAPRLKILNCCQCNDGIEFFGGTVLVQRIYWFHGQQGWWCLGYFDQALLSGTIDQCGSKFSGEALTMLLKLMGPEVYRALLHFQNVLFSGSATATDGVNMTDYRNSNAMGKQNIYALAIPRIGKRCGIGCPNDVSPKLLGWPN